MSSKIKKGDIVYVIKGDGVYPEKVIEFDDWTIRTPDLEYYTIGEGVFWIKPEADEHYEAIKLDRELQEANDLVAEEAANEVERKANEMIDAYMAGIARNLSGYGFTYDRVAPGEYVICHDGSAKDSKWPNIAGWVAFAVVMTGAVYHVFASL